ncbi:MAG: DUF5693 family protein [Eubacteriales bacterium]
MEKLIRSNKILFGIIIFAIIIAAVVIIGRMNVEKNAKSYDIVLDYSELSQMAAQSENNISWWLNEFKGMGINKVGLAEESLISLSADKETPVSAKMMYEVLKGADWKSNYPTKLISDMEAKGFDEYDVMVEAKSKGSFDFISSAVKDRFSQDKYIVNETSNGGYIVLNGNSKDALYTAKTKNLNSIGIGFTEQDAVSSSKIMYVSLGLLPSKVAIAEAAGMEIIPRTTGYKGWNDLKYAKAVISGYSKLKQVPEYALFSGEETLGFDQDPGYIAKILKDNGTIVGMIENTTQLQNIMPNGLNEIVQGLNYYSVRTFSVWDYIQNRYQYYGYAGSEEIENTLFRAIDERNIRLVYFKPIKEFKDNHTYITDLKEYKTLFTNVESRLAEQNFAMGKASVMTAKFIPAPFRIFMGLGCVAAVVLLFKTIIPINRKLEMGMLGIMSMGVLGAFFVSKDLAPLLVSFAYALIFPCLATIYMLKQSKYHSSTLDKNTSIGKIIIKSCLILLGSVIIVLVGGLMTAAPISDISYMLEINIFRGVKVAQLLPIAFFPIAYLAYYGFGEMKTTSGKLEIRDLKDMMNSSIKIWMVVIGVIAAAVGVYYISRTGNDSEIAPSTFEMLMRNTLEATLLARPRTKEFLFAFPTIMLLVYTSIRGFKVWPIIFGVSSVIGLTSVVNTFMHIRTPFYLGLARTGYSLVIGMAIGIICILVFEGIYILYKKLQGKRMLNE